MTAVVLKGPMDRLRDSESRLRAIIASTGAAVVCTDDQFRVTEFNAAAERVFGRARDDVIGSPYSHLMPPMLREKVERDCRRVLDGEPIQHLENVIITPSGESTVMLWDMRSFPGAEGGAAGLIAVGHDITARQDAEALLERRRRDLETLTSLHQTLVGAPDAESIAAVALKHLVQLIDCSSAAVYEVRSDEREPQLLGSLGTVPSALPTTHGAEHADASELVLPLVAGGEQIGLLYVAFALTNDASTPLQVALAGQVADRLASALLIARLDAGRGAGSRG